MYFHTVGIMENLVWATKGHALAALVVKVGVSVRSCLQKSSLCFSADSVFYPLDDFFSSLSHLDRFLALALI